MSEVAPAGGGPNRIFIVIALGLVGLLVIGIVVFLLFLFVVQPALNAARSAVAPTRAVTITFATTPTRAALLVFTPTVVVPSDTPPPTLVVQPAGGTQVAVGALSPTAGTTGTPGSGLPPTGLGEDLLMLAGGVVLVFVFLAARHARTSAAM